MRCVMDERRLRLAVSAAMVVTLFLPLHPDTGLVVTWIYFAVQMAPPYAPYNMALPILALLNLYLAFHTASKWLKVAYRGYLLAYCSLIWLLLSGNTSPGVQVGFWAMPIVVTAGVFVEVFLIMSRWLRKPAAASR
jgi:hypothetical protein